VCRHKNDGCFEEALISQQLKVLLACACAIAICRLVATFDGPWVLVAAALGTIAIVVIIVAIRRQYRRERPKPPWPPDVSDMPESKSGPALDPDKRP
jgi:hypothetical protein